MHKTRLVVGALSLASATAAWAAAVPLGEPLGTSLGSLLGATFALGLGLGTGLPIAGIGLVSVAAASLVVAVRIVRRKHRR